MAKPNTAAPPEPPPDAEVQAQLGAAAPLYHALLTGGPFTPEWKYYGAKYGWSLKLFEKKRNLCFIRPQEGAFAVSFALGEAAVADVLAGPSRATVKDELRAGKKYPEGRMVRVTVAGEADLEEVRILLAAKRAPRK